jgi:hypothetical protein
MRHPALEPNDAPLKILTDETIEKIAGEEWSDLFDSVLWNILHHYRVEYGIQDADHEHTDGPKDKVMEIIARKLSDIYLK